jgi:hypothetical protein
MSRVNNPRTFRLNKARHRTRTRFQDNKVVPKTSRRSTDQVAVPLGQTSARSTTNLPFPALLTFFATITSQHLLRNLLRNTKYATLSGSHGEDPPTNVSDLINKTRGYSGCFAAHLRVPSVPSQGALSVLFLLISMMIQTEETMVPKS